MSTSRKRILIYLLPVLIAVGYKISLLAWGVFPFNSDEAIVGLMAKHILSGSTPVFFYGQSYMGSLDAYLVAGGFAIFGEQIWVIRAVQVFLYALVVLSAVLVILRVSGQPAPGLVTGLLLAIPTVNVTLYTTVSLGGYNESLLLGNLILLITIQIYLLQKKQGRNTLQLMFLFMWGIVSGLGIWANGLTLVYILPAGAFLLLGQFKKPNKGRRREIFLRLPVVAFGLLIGSIPYWLYGFQHGWLSLINELLGSAVAVESGNWFQRSFQHGINFLLLGLPVLLGLRPPWEVRWLALPLIPFVLLFWGWVISDLRTIKALPGTSKYFIHLLSGVSLVLVSGFLFTSFGVDPSGRYFLPLFVIMAYLAGLLFIEKNQKLRIAGVIVVILFHLISTIQSGFHSAGITTQFYAPAVIDHQYDEDLIEFLIDKGEYYGYSNYWVAYPLAFRSDERLLYVPWLPYHPDMRYTSRDDRYEPYTQIVESSKRIAYITTNNPTLNSYLREAFQDRAISWREKSIGDFQIFYDLSGVIRPQEIGLGISN